MKSKNPLILSVLIFVVLSLVHLFGSPVKSCFADGDQMVFLKDTYYDIYYMLQDQTQYITKVKISDQVVINGITFLEIESSSLPVSKSGYISFSSIVAILPSGYPKPQVLE